eukprot:superscaffoldBa00005827_g20829
MNEGTPQSTMAESNNLNGSQRRRSPRYSSSSTDNKMALTAVAVKRLNSFMSLLEGADDCGGSAVPEVDTNIPGVAVVKEKRRRKKVQQINTTELEELAAKMNAEFEEAEEFELTVE